MKSLLSARADIAAELVSHDPAAVSYGSGIVADWMCPHGHEYKARIAHRASGKSNCPVCSGRKVVAGVNDIATTHPSIASEIVSAGSDTVYHGSTKKHKWLCSNGHEQEISARQRVRNGGCSICTNRVVVPGANDIAVRAPGLAAQIADRSAVSGLSASSKTPVEWECDAGHKWFAQPNNRFYHNSGCPRCANRSSSGEQKIYDSISDLTEVQRNVRGIIPPYELDLYLPDKNFAIEYNGTYWHSTQYSSKWLHFNKWKMCRDAGIQLITIWDTDDSDVYVKMLREKILGRKPIGARKTSVAEIDYNVAGVFLDSNHIQGRARGSKYLALNLDDEIVAVGVFTFLPKGICRVDRYCSSIGVQGGLSKMMKATGQVNFVTFADHTVSDGSLYLNSGWTADKFLQPDYKYLYNRRLHHKFNFRRKRFRDDPHLIYKDGLSESELASLNNIYRVYDCGKTRYVKSLHNSK